MRAETRNETGPVRRAKAGHAARAIAGVFWLGLLLAGCGQSTIRPRAAERTIADFVSSHTGFRPTDVHCPSGVPARPSGTFDCHFTGPDAPYVAQVKIISVHGQRVDQQIATHPVPGATVRRTIDVRATQRLVNSSVLKHTGFRPTDTSCGPVGIPATPGAVIDCHFTGPDGKYVARVRITGVHGTSTTDRIVTRKLAQ